ncbi:S8 family serine peptidase [Engelhardtia mirabilis]|uniref:Thermophilic serine proteinase n=1 Tax=Engelhardtia mirabilis TaxID=2528011 RepID=A0A518BRB4_9BACT|nr:Thermophilic serine proteinase precursor [Planctomycetes bacterium Pla133]QDV03840.1 Thermophilic serine proteinase precursor [Planctomycetes bacterium Pla86]
MKLLPHTLLGLTAVLASASAATAQLEAPKAQRGASAAVAGASVAPIAPIVLNQVLVGLAPGVAPADVAAQVGGILIDQFGDPLAPLSAGGPGLVALLQLPQGQGVDTAHAFLTDVPGVIFVEGNTAAGPPEGCGGKAVTGPQQCTAAFFDATPTGPEYTDQAAVPAIALNGSTAPQAGSPTIVAVIDTGIDLAHPLLAGNIHAPGFDFVLGQPVAADLANGIDDDGDGQVDEAHGHGTHMAGLIVLVDPMARLIPYRVLDADGVGTSYDVARAIYRAAIDGAEVINLSLSLAEPSAAVEEAIEFAHDECHIAIVAAAGNTGSLGVVYPAAYHEVIAVAAVGVDDVVAPFSAFGKEVDVCAPGVDVYSAMPGNQYALWSGTSMSTAIVSGGVSRLHSWSSKAHEPEANTDALADAAHSLESTNPLHNDQLGSGRIDIAQAGVKLLHHD